MDVRLSWKTKATKRENLGGVRNASLLGMIKYRDNSCRAVPAGWYFKIVASSGSTALARESEGRWKKPRHETRGRYRRHRRRDRERETRGATRDRRRRERNGRGGGGWGKKETRRGGGMAAPTSYSASQISEELKIPGLFYARIIAPAYDRPRPLILHPAFQPLPRKREETDGGTGKVLPRISLSVYFASPISILVALSFLSFLSDTLLSTFFVSFRVSDMKTVGRRTSERGGLLKNALAPSAKPYGSPTATRCSRISPGKVFQTLKMHGYPDRALGRGSPNRYPRIHRIWSVQHSYIHVYMYVTSLLRVLNRWAMGISLWKTCR